MALFLAVVSVGVLGFLIGFLRTSVGSGESAGYSTQSGLFGMALAVTAVLLAAAVTRFLGRGNGRRH